MYRLRQYYRRLKDSRARRKLEQTTDIFFEDLMGDATTLQCNEACLTEDDKFVGATGKFSDAWKIVNLRTDLLPKEYGT